MWATFSPSRFLVFVFYWMMCRSKIILREPRENAAHRIYSDANVQKSC